MTNEESIFNQNNTISITEEFAKEISMTLNNTMEDFVVLSVEQFGDDRCQMGVRSKLEVNAKKIYEAVEKADIYRWHDKRKNPNDLPKDGETVLVYMKGGYLLLWNACKEIFCLESWERVIAWKYIEPFEEE